MSKGRLSRMMKKINAQQGADATVTATALSYRIRVNGRRLWAVGHNTTPEFFIVNTQDGKLRFFPMRRLRKVVIGAEYQQLMRQRALAATPKPPGKAGLQVIRKPGVIVPGGGDGPLPGGEGA